MESEKEKKLRERFRELESKAAAKSKTVSKNRKYTLGVVAILFGVVILPIYDMYSCTVMQFLGIANERCDNTNLIDQLKTDANFGNDLSSTEISRPNTCADSKFTAEYFTDSEIESWLSQAKMLMDFLEKSLQNPKTDYKFAYKDAYDKKIRLNKILQAGKCYEGDDKWKIATEIARMDKFISDKMSVLYKKAYN